MSDTRNVATTTSAVAATAAVDDDKCQRVEIDVIVSVLVLVFMCVPNMVTSQTY